MKKKLNAVVEVLMNRDGMTQKEAEVCLNEVREMIFECEGNYSEAEEIIAGELGLEMDYLFDII